MAVNLSPLGGVGAQFFDSNGNPLSGGMIYTYAAGTNTPQATYTSSAGTIQHSNPIVLDAAGRVPTGEIWLTDGVAYKFVIQTSAAVLVGTYDNIVGINSNFVAFTLQQEIQTATAGQTVFTLATMQYQPGTNSLSVFVDGVNQYGPGAQYAYVETDSDTVTFVSGLHVGASVKFTTAASVSSNYADAAQVTYDPPFTGAVATNVEAKLAQTISVKDFGAVGDGVTDDTDAFIAAIGTGTVNVYVPAGTYLVSSIVLQSWTTLYGEGYASIIKSDGSSNHTITGTHVQHCTIRDLRILGNSGKTNLCGIYMNGAVWTTLQNLYVGSNGSHGIQFTDTGTAYVGCYPVMIRGVHSEANGGDGCKIQATSGSTNQENAISIFQSEFQGNGGNGLTLWGTGVNVLDAVSEGNTGYGVYIDNGKSSGTTYSAWQMSVKNTYFELNTAGHIGVRVGTYGVISGLEIIGNTFVANTAVTTISYIPVKVTNYSTSLNAIRSLNFTNNTYLISGTALTNYADFANAPDYSSTINPSVSISTAATDIVTVPSQFINLGFSTFKYINSLVLHGYWFAKGGSGITYSGRDHSDSVTVSGSSTYFPIQLPLGSELYYFSVPVDTDCASYTVNMYLQAKSYGSTSAPATIAFASGTGSGAQIVKTSTIPTYAAVSLVTNARSEMVLFLQVTWATPGTYFVLGSPTIYYTQP